MISRLLKPRSGHDVRLLLLPVMIVSLLLAVATGAAALVLNGQPSGDKAADAADVFGWVFAGAFLAAFVLAILQERKQPIERGRDAVGTSPRAQHHP